MRKEEEETEIIIGEKYPKPEKGKKIEVTRKYTPKEVREAANGLLFDGLYSDIDEVCRITQAHYKTGGLVRQPVKDGGGYTHFEWVFAGNARTTIVSNRAEGEDSLRETANIRPDYSDHVAWNPKPEWSLGTNTLAIEAKLRKHKQQEGYTEVTPKVQRRGGKRIGAGRKPK